MNFLSFLLLILVSNACTTPIEKVNSPNIVFLLVDDLGWNDLGCYGSTFYETPNIDQLAKDGMRFTDAYASCPVCSPSRASILTGKHPARLNITDWIPGLDPKDKPLLGTQDRHELPLEEETLAERFKKAGYKTAFFGKWHLGDQGYYPENQGFDINKGGHWAGQPASYFYPYKNDRKRWDVPGLEGGEQGEYLTDRLTKEAIQFIGNNQEDPFFLYLAYYTVHTPIQAKQELISKYEQKKAQLIGIDLLNYKPERDVRTKQRQDNSAYAGMVQSLDESVGKIIESLEKLNLSDNTIIILTSDNGGLTTLPNKRRAPTSVVPLRAGKGWLYEGGIRVPLIVKYPGQVEAGTTCSSPVTGTDYYPTLLEMASLPLDPPQHLDGKSIVPLLKQDSIERTNLFWHFPHYHGSGNRPSAAIRSGDYKLIQWFEDQSIELYNLKQDLGEKNNLVESMPQKAQALKAQLYNWQNEIGALKPSPNPDYQTKR